MTKKIGIFVFQKSLSEMDTPFIYDKFVTGRNFIGRKTECHALRNLLEKEENICIYEPPKTGKMSLIQQTLFNMRMSGKQFSSVRVSLFNVRDEKTFMLKLCSALVRSAASTPAEYEEIVDSMLGGTHFTFDMEQFSLKDETVSLKGVPDVNDLQSLFRLPQKIAGRSGEPVFVILEEFQNVLDLGEESSDRIFGTLLETLRDRQTGNAGHASFIFTGSKVNAMKFIFEERKFFYRQAEHIPIPAVDKREISDHIMRGFQTGGKVISQDLIDGAVELFKGNLWYINHFAAICDSLSKGFLNEGTLMDALGMILSIHETRFRSITDDLTTHQLNFLKAILDGENKFSSVEVVGKYGLHSSANVRRVKDALKKKEIITFNEKDEPVFLDPLYEYWLGRVYFE